MENAARCIYKFGNLPRHRKRIPRNHGKQASQQEEQFSCPRVTIRSSMANYLARTGIHAFHLSFQAAACRGVPFDLNKHFSHMYSLRLSSLPTYFYHFPSFKYIFLNEKKKLCTKYFRTLETRDINFSMYVARKNKYMGSGLTSAKSLRTSLSILHVYINFKYRNHVYTKWKRKTILRQIGKFQSRNANPIKAWTKSFEINILLKETVRNNDMFHSIFILCIKVTGKMFIL